MELCPGPGPRRSPDRPPPYAPGTPGPRVPRPHAQLQQHRALDVRIREGDQGLAQRRPPDPRGRDTARLAGRRSGGAGQRQISNAPVPHRLGRARPLLHERQFDVRATDHQPRAADEEERRGGAACEAPGLPAGFRRGAPISPRPLMSFDGAPCNDSAHPQA
eukprot:8239707-Pyramimonas_sp.AAC.1